MKKNRFLLLFFLLLAANAAVYFPSCQRDSDQLQLKPLSDVPVDSRDCSLQDKCVTTVTTDATTTLTLCGDLPQATTSCTGCDTGETGESGTFLQNTPREFCVDKSGDLCITNTGFSSVLVTVHFGGTSLPMSVTIGASQTHCFHTDNNCYTYDGCS